MENERNENLPPGQAETKPSGVLSFLPGFKSTLSPIVRMNPTSPSVNPSTQNRLRDMSSPNRSILRDINSIISFSTSPKSTDTNGAGSSPSVKEEPETIVKGVLNDIVSGVPDRSGAKNRVSGISEVSENSFETAIGGEPVGHLPDLVQSGTSFQSGFGSDTDTSAVYESAGENEDSVSPEESYRDFSYDGLYDTPDADATKVLDSSAGSASTVTAPCFSCVDTDSPSDLKENTFVLKKNPALSHLHGKPDLNLSDLANNLQQLHIQTPFKSNTAIPPHFRSVDNSVLELSDSTETEWLDSDVEVNTRGGRPSDPVIVYEGKRSGRPSVEVLSQEVGVLNTTVDVTRNGETDQSGQVPECVELSTDSISESESIRIPEESKEEEVPAILPTDTEVIVDVSRLSEEPCELKPDNKGTHAEVGAIATALEEVSLKESVPANVETQASCNLNAGEVAPPVADSATVEEHSGAVDDTSAAVKCEERLIDTVGTVSGEVKVAQENTAENDKVASVDVAAVISFPSEEVVSTENIVIGEIPSFEVDELTSSPSEVVATSEDTVENDKGTPVETLSSGEVFATADNSVKEVVPADVLQLTSSPSKVAVDSETTLETNKVTPIDDTDETSSAAVTPVENGEVTSADTVDLTSHPSKVSVALENTVENDKVIPVGTVEISSTGEVLAVADNSVKDVEVVPVDEVTTASSPSKVAVETELLVATQAKNPASPVTEAQVTSPERIVASDESSRSCVTLEQSLGEDFEACEAEVLLNLSEANGEVSLAQPIQEEVLPVVSVIETVKGVETSENLSKAGVLPATPELVKLCQAEPGEDLVKEEVAGVHSVEKLTEQVPEAVVADETAQERVLTQEPFKETQLAANLAEVPKGVGLQAASPEENVGEVRGEAPVEQTAQQASPVEHIEEVKEISAAVILEETPKEITRRVPEGNSGESVAERTEDLSKEEVVATELTEKLSEQVSHAVVAEETVLEQTLLVVPQKESAEQISVAVTPEATPEKDIVQTLTIEDDVIKVEPVGLPDEFVCVQSTEKTLLNASSVTPKKEAKEEVTVLNTTEEVSPEGVTIEFTPAELIPAKPVNEELCKGVEAVFEKPIANNLVELEIKKEVTDDAGIVKPLPDVAWQTPPVAALRASVSNSETSCSPALLQGVATSTPLEYAGKHNDTINLDDTIEVPTLNESPGDLNCGLTSPQVLDLSKSSEAPLDLSSSEAPLNVKPPLNVKRSSGGPLDLRCSQTTPLNSTCTINKVSPPKAAKVVTGPVFDETFVNEVSPPKAEKVVTGPSFDRTFVNEISPPKAAKVISGPSFDQTFDAGGFGEPNFNSTFLKNDQTFTQQANSTFVVPEEQPANAAVERRPTPPKSRTVFPSADAGKNSLRSLIAVCEQQEKDLREEDDLVHGEKEPSPDFEALSAEAAKVAEEISLTLEEIDQKDLNNETIIMANNVDDVNPFATKSKIAVSPPLGRRELPPTLNGSQGNNTFSSKVNAFDVNVSEAGPDTAGDHFQSEEIFRDPATFDFLSQLGSSSSRRELAKESLYVKFDPLVGFTSNTTSDIPLPGLLTMQDNNSETKPSKEEHPDERPDEPSGDSTNTAVPETTKKVESAVEETSETEPLPPPRTPLRTKATALATDTLISLSPAAGPATLAPKKVEAPATPVQGATTKDTSLRGQIVTQEELIRRLQEHQIVLEEQDKAYQDRIAELQRENEQLNKKVQEKAQGLNQLSLIMKEYEKTISRLVAEKEQEKKAHEEEKENLIKERDSIQVHLNNIEIAFADLHKKYERSKAMIEGFKKNEEVLNAAAAENKANLDQMQSMYDKLKSHAVQKLDTANQELVAIQQRHQQETAKLNAIVKKLEIKSKSLEESLEQKTKENQALAQICDELINANN